MKNAWSSNSVHIAHGYQNLEKTTVHDNFLDWINRIYSDKKIKIVDIGGGNGRVCLNIDKNIEKYWCLDINSDNIRVGIEYFKNDDRIEFIELDVDNEKFDIECDVVYIDSVLTMLNDPFKFLSEFSKKCDFIFVNRTHLKEMTKKDYYKWGGMSEYSPHWAFGEQDMIIFCRENNLILEKYSNFFVIKSNNKN